MSGEQEEDTVAAILSVPECPWPGPRPYEVAQAGVFFGREREAETICSRLLADRLTILTGPSGVGKTSLLRAGVQSTLLAAHNSGNPSKDRAWVPPVLLLRHWGAAAAESIDRLFGFALHAAIDDLTGLKPGDYEALSTVPQGVDFFNDVVSLCAVGRGVILLFDQFEEVLRAGKGAAGDALEIITNLYRLEHRVRLLLSLRSEHLADIGKLDSHVQGLIDRTYFLRPLRRETVEQAIVSSAKAANLSFARAAAAELLLWVAETSDNHAETDMRPPTRCEVSERDEPVELLTLQTILFELCKHVHGLPQPRRSPSGSLSIDETTLNDYREGRGLDVVVGQALERWVERSLEMQEGGGLGEPAGLISRLPEEHLSGTIRRTASRIGPFLSSGGFKIAAEEQDFLWGVIRNDLRTLRPGLDKQAIRLLSPTGTPPCLDREPLGLSQEHTERTRENLSGFSQVLGWSPADTADAIVQMFFETLRRLGDGNVVKSIRIGADHKWELVHDGLGRPLTRWGEKRESSWEDSVYALVASRGQAITVDRGLGTQTLHNMVWLGCSIRPLEDAVLEDMVFDECDLRGTIFKDCTFVGGTFDTCALEGVIFIDCKFKPGPDAVPVVFRGCERTSGLTFRGSQSDQAHSTIVSIRFEDCQLDGLAMVGLTLDGPVHFTSETTLFRADFSHLSMGNSGEGRLEFGESCRAEFCAWDEQSEPFMPAPVPPQWSHCGRRGA